MDRHLLARTRLRRATRAVAQQIGMAGSDVPWDFRVATVTDASPLTIQYGDGVDVPNVAAIASYFPRLNDIVLVMVRSPVATILGTFSPGMDWASYSGTTDGSQNLVVTHGAGFTPSAVLVQSTTPSGGANQGYPVVTAKSSSTFTLRYMNSAGAGSSTASLAVAGYYLILP